KMTLELIASWCADWSTEVQSLAQQTPSVQTPAQMLADAADKTAALNGVADRIYAEWLKGLMRDA
ncbi:MAG TPA: hypothetical protein VK642_15560, partial [Burkholderiales bacterium]|nr:hypothetical protein [Burkholderiales bacterium]